MTKIQKRLEKGVAMLQQLDKERLEACTPLLGVDAEFEIVTREFAGDTAANVRARNCDSGETLDG